MCGVFVAACLTPVQFTSPTAPPGGSLDDLCKSTGVPRYAEDGLEAYWSKAKEKKKKKSSCSQQSQEMENERHTKRRKKKTQQKSKTKRCI